MEKWLKPPQTIKGVVNEENRYLRLITLPETDIAPLKNGCLDATFLLGRPIFTGELLVSGRVCIGLCIGWLWWCCLDFFFRTQVLKLSILLSMLITYMNQRPELSWFSMIDLLVCWQRFKISKKNSLHFGFLHHFPRNHGILVFVVQAEEFLTCSHFLVFQLRRNGKGQNAPVGRSQNLAKKTPLHLGCLKLVVLPPPPWSC